MFGPFAARRGAASFPVSKSPEGDIMPLVLGIDLGTTKITALALDTNRGDIVASSALPNQAEITHSEDKSRGFSEWNTLAMVAAGCGCLREIAGQLQERHHELSGLGITGQQHGGVIIDEAMLPLTPFINWQDRRGDHVDSRSGKTYVRLAAEQIGENAPQRTGCRLATGYLGVTLLWLKETRALPSRGTCCFLMDYFEARLTGQRPVTDATCAASSGLFDVAAGTWAQDLITALGLPPALFPRVRPSGDLLGSLTPAAAAETGLPAGLPVFVGIGDNQASFLGSVAHREGTVLVNVGTGAQVAAFTEKFVYDPLLETRPFPHGGYLLVSAGLSGGAAYAVLERFFETVGAQLFDRLPASPLYPAMNRLAAQVPRGADGLRCEPYFAGTRAQPELRASLTGLSTTNFTPAHLTRALLEGMARSFQRGFEVMTQRAPPAGRRLVGAGNGLRENPVLAQIVAETFALPLAVPRHREEAAFGAALLAAMAAEVLPDLASAGRLIRYENEIR
jgi:sugar (pentulose or hexulose) kinase